jgi:peroxiredoxin
MRVMWNLVTAMLVFAGAAGAAEDPGRILRDAELTAVDGSFVSIGDLAGQVVIVNFWATWCRPCQRELTTLDAWREELSGQGVRVVAISVDTDRRKVDRFLKRHDVQLTVVHDGPDGLARQMDLPSLPCTFVFDSQGEVVWVADASDDDALSQLYAKVVALTPTPSEVSR